MMKKISTFLVVILIGLQLSAQTSATNSTTKELYQPTNVSIEESLSYLASDELAGRKIGSEGIEKAAQYIENVFKDYQLKPYFETYRDSFEFKGNMGYNLVAYKEGSDPELKHELVVLGAHYDHIGIINSKSEDTIANGANDNASGTTSILELAKYFSARETKRSLLFVLFSGEEEGLKGSEHLAKRLKEEKASLYVMLNYEMIGVPLQNTSYTAYLTGYNQSNFADKFNQYAQKEVFGFFPKAKAYNLFKRSDNYPFYEAFHIPAQTLCTFDFSNYDYYHKVGDEVQLMDINHIRKLIEETIPGIEGMANSSAEEIKLKTE